MPCPDTESEREDESVATMWAVVAVILGAVLAVCVRPPGAVLCGGWALGWLAGVWPLAGRSGARLLWSRERWAWPAGCATGAASVAPAVDRAGTAPSVAVGRGQAPGRGVDPGEGRSVCPHPRHEVSATASNRCSILLSRIVTESPTRTVPLRGLRADASYTHRTDQRIMS